MEWTHGDYRLSDDPARLDLDAVCALLHATSWAADWPRALIETAVQHSICFSLLHQDRQVGFARAVTDRVTFAWICDVVVHPDHRGRGLGTWLLQCVLAHPDVQTRTQALRTREAAGFYAQFGFCPVEYLRRSMNPP